MLDCSSHGLAVNVTSHVLHFPLSSTKVTGDIRNGGQCLGTVENHGNTEIMETEIFVKCHDFAKTPCLPCSSRFFCNKTLILISVI